MNLKKSRRDKIKKLFKKAVYGPLFGDEEVIDTHPLNLYATGIICPSELTNNFKVNTVESDETVSDIEKESESEEKNEDSFREGEDITKDIDIPKQNKYSVNISSLGATFICKKEIEEINVEISYSRYQVEKSLPFETYKDKNGKEVEIKKYKYACQKYHWAETCKLINNNKKLISNKNNLLLELSIKISKASNYPNSTGKIVSLFIINETPLPASSDEYNFSLRNKKNLPLLIFRPELNITIKEKYLEDLGSTVKIDFSNDEENNMLYRGPSYKRYGRGHNCSVSYDTINQKLFTKFIPEQKTKWLNTSLKNNIKEEIFKVNYLINQDLNKEEILSKIESMAISYKDWINTNKISENYEEQYDINKKICNKTANRIKEGIEILRKDDCIYSIWQDTHRAMKIQFKKANKKELIYRPFQLAFLLMMLESIVNEKSSDRDIADLLWVPTGGGKTEAYLAVSAFTILFRRRKYRKKGIGLAVISRYTLRLLTAQQFERTAKLICALELLRRQNENDYGQEEISLGLFIGGTSSPNTIDKAIIKIGKNATKEFPLQRCPWCGTELSNKSKSVYESQNSFYKRDQPKRFYIQCNNPDCDFYKNKKIPVQFVDEMLERETPSMIICTADKFAMTPFQIEKFLNIIMKGRPPELVIQDELHLIDSALGSIFGLYETTNSLLWEKDFKMKIIASTATPKEAGAQIKLLFNRKTSIFPKPLSQIDDTFFSRLENIDYGRCYLGFMPTCTSAKNGMIITLSSFLAASAISKNEIPLMNEFKNYFLDSNDDPYKMVTCYFSSIRELGGTMASLDDEITKRLSFILKYLYFSTNYENNKDFDYFSRLTNNKEKKYSRNKYKGILPLELTGRISNAELTKNLSRIENKNLPDVLMSTNMISVGIDIEDLNLMIVNGQTKKTAEYIQASSRSGRRKENPGLVLTLYNPVKIRDISYYEYFNSYHQTFYRYIEPVSVTPFSSQCLRRGLLAQLVSLMRNKEKGNKSITLKEDSYNILCDELWEKIAEKITVEKEKEIKKNFVDIKNYKWNTVLKKVIQSKNPRYAFIEGQYNNQSDKKYAIKFINEKKHNEYLEFAEGCMTSFRDVSGECRIKIEKINYED